MIPFAKVSLSIQEVYPKNGLVLAIVDLSTGLHSIKKIPTFLLFAECEMLLYGTLSTSRRWCDILAREIC